MFESGKPSDCFHGTLNTLQISLTAPPTLLWMPHFLSRVVSAQSCLTLVIPWTAAHQAPLSTEFSRQEYWSRLSFPTPGGLLGPGDRTRVPCSSCIGRLILYQLCHVGSPHSLIGHPDVCFLDQSQLVIKATSSKPSMHGLLCSSITIFFLSFLMLLLNMLHSK